MTNRTGRLIVKTMHPELVKMGYDIPASCIGILGELWERDGLSQKELGLSIIKTKSSINKMLQQLIDAKLIIKKTDGADRRISRIYLTASGKALKNKLRVKSKELDQILTTEHSAEEIATTKKVLATLYKKLLERNQDLNAKK